MVYWRERAGNKWLSTPVCSSQAQIPLSLCSTFYSTTRADVLLNSCAYVWKCAFSKILVMSPPLPFHWCVQMFCGYLHFSIYTLWCVGLIAKSYLAVCPSLIFSFHIAWFLTMIMFLFSNGLSSCEVVSLCFNPAMDFDYDNWISPNKQQTELKWKDSAAFQRSASCALNPYQPTNGVETVYGISTVVMVMIFTTVKFKLG